MARMPRLLAWFTNGTATLSALCVIILILHVTLDVLLRLLFNMPFSATILFASAYYMVAIAFLSLARVEQDDAHISVEVVTSLLPDRVVGAFYGFSLILTVLVAAALTLRTWEEAMTKFRIGSFTIEAGDKILTWPSYFILPVGFGLMLLVTLWKIMRFVVDARNGLAATLPKRPSLTTLEPGHE